LKYSRLPHVGFCRRPFDLDVDSAPVFQATPTSLDSIRDLSPGRHAIGIDGSTIYIRSFWDRHVGREIAKKDIAVVELCSVFFESVAQARNNSQRREQPASSL
jgi:hypothetical protein